MPTPPLSRELAEEAVRWMQSGIDRGLSQNAVARELGIAQGTLLGRLQRAKALYGLEPDNRAPPPVREAPIAKPVVRVKANSQPSDAPVYRVLGVGDAHDSPELDKTRFQWLGRHAAETRPDAVVFIGDIADFDSLSRHALPGSVSDKLRPSYARDLESLEEALSLFRKAYTDGIVHNTLGNHEGRIWRYEEASASAEGMLKGPFLDVMARFDIRVHNEGEYLLIGGTAWVHCPRTLLNREYGGRWLNSIANDARVSMIFGHSHRGQILHAHKIGPWGGITLVNLGTALPMGYIKPYAKIATSSWTWGCYNLTIQAGQIIGHEFVSMDDLQRRYGD